MEEELEGMQDNMAAELSRTARQARAESERELEQKQTKISSLSRENDKLQNEVQTAFVWYSTCYRESESDFTATKGMQELTLNLLKSLSARNWPSP